MTTTLRQADIPQLLPELEQVTGQVQHLFGALTGVQLNWKPSATEWSIGQCLDHLVITNTAYFPTFQQCIEGKKQATFWERLPWFPAFCGKMMIRVLDPANPQRVQAPRAFQPVSSTVRAEIVSTFVAQQEQMIELMRASQALPVTKMIITSPAASWITYSLLDACRILVVHEQRHLLQMEGVLRMAEFPGGGD